MTHDADAKLHELNPTGRFSDRVEDYKRFRPSYPAAAIDAILHRLGDPSRLIAADIGAGTGISTRLLADRGVRVLAVEPNAAMRSGAEPHARIEWRDGKAERTGLADACVALVVSAQAYHWFEPVAAVREFARVLRRPGRLALMWNERDRRDALTRGYTEAILAVGGEHPAETRDIDFKPVTAEGLFVNFRRVETLNEQALDLPGLIGRATSASYAPKQGPRFAELVRLLTALHTRHAGRDGLVRMMYRTEVYLADPAAS